MAEPATRWLRLGALAAAVVALVGTALTVVPRDSGPVLTTAGQPADPSGALTLSYVPAGFALIQDVESSNPRGERVRTLRYAPRGTAASVPGLPASAELVVMRLVGGAVDPMELASQVGFDPAAVGGRPAGVSRRGGRVALQWAPTPTVVLAVHGGTILAEAEVRRIADGVVYDPALDDLRVTLVADPPGGRPAVVVAEGNDGADHWELSAHLSDQGLCVLLRHGASSGRACGHAMGPDGVIGGGPSGGTGWQFLDGPVRKDVVRVAVELDDGGTIALRPVGTDSGFDVNFYATPVPPERRAVRAVAFDGAGSAVGEVRFRPPPPQPPGRRGPRSP